MHVLLENDYLFVIFVENSLLLKEKITVFVEGSQI